jgi:hypothetical protein
MILCIKDPKDYIKNLLGQISTFDSIAEYATNIQKTVNFLFTKNEQAKKEIWKAILLTLNS